MASSSSKKSKYICEKGMTYSQCELHLLRNAIDVAEKRHKQQQANTPEIKQLIMIVENFIKEKKFLLYGGTAINNLLPPDDQFYTVDDIPDYDSYSKSALKDAKQLADIYYKAGFGETEAKSGIHHGTFKVFVSGFSIADITQLPPDLFDELMLDAVEKDGFYYTPINYLRASCYLELSRPNGDITTRWEKIFKRLAKLNAHYPLTPYHCKNVDFQRRAIGTTSVAVSRAVSHGKTQAPSNRDDVILATPKTTSVRPASVSPLTASADEIYDIVKHTFIEDSCVFFGGLAITLYAHYMPPSRRKRVQKIPDFDVLHENPEVVAKRVKRALAPITKNVTIVRHPPLGEILAEHYEICVDANTIAFLYRPLACHSYNIGERGVKVATIDTILSFYLTFIYTGRPYYDRDRLLCMADYLFDVQQSNRLHQDGLLRRFSINCIGHQPTLIEMRSKKMEMFNTLRRGSKEFEEWFLRYRPADKAKRVAAAAAAAPATRRRRKRAAPAAAKTRRRRRVSSSGSSN